ncbi:Uncharacterised protein [Bordetella pertussis]|nr:Uncharacterised protein [Bordetella pertussis]CPJ15132.1 Uncharacterised protein [Bordetella pertussis]CPM41224.1 Uncharacterised protein [Bordetella pertussis]CPN00606.1 Uncharacterised protein [Bordetella pertussis]CPN91491.1 Uncharacterised protein [Bordetella pertussis]
MRSSSRPISKDDTAAPAMVAPYSEATLPPSQPNSAESSGNSMGSELAAPKLSEASTSVAAATAQL